MRTLKALMFAVGLAFHPTSGIAQATHVSAPAEDYISVAELAMLLVVFVAPVYALALVLLHRWLRHRGLTRAEGRRRSVVLLAVTCLLAIVLTLAIGVVCRPLLNAIAGVLLGRTQLELVVYLTVPALAASAIALSAGALLSRVVFRPPSA